MTPKYTPFVSGEEGSYWRAVGSPCVVVVVCCWLGCLSLFFFLEWFVEVSLGDGKKVAAWVSGQFFKVWFSRSTGHKWLRLAWNWVIFKKILRTECPWNVWKYLTKFCEAEKAKSFFFQTYVVTDLDHLTLPWTKIAPEHGWLEDDPFLLEWPIFRCNALVSRRVDVLKSEMGQRSERQP